LVFVTQLLLVFRRLLLLLVVLMRPIRVFLVDADELKSSFVGKSAFSTTVDVADENGLWLYKATGSGGALYVCYIPKAKSNRQLVGNLYCLNATGPTRVANGGPWL